MSNLPPPQFPPPEPHQPSHTEISQIVDEVSVQTSPTSWFRKPFLKLPVWTWIVAVVALVGIGVAVSQSGGDEQSTTLVVDSTVLPDDSVAPETTVEGSEPTITEPDDTTPATTPATEPPSTSPSGSEVVAGAPAGERGTQSAPVAPGAIADIGAGWRLQVLDFLPDATAAIASENEFNDPPPPGQTFSIVRVALGYFGLEDPVAAFEPTINALGADKVQLDGFCGTIPDDISLFTDVFAGGVIVGNLCFVTTPADAEGITLYANADFFNGDDVFLQAAPSAAGTAPMAALTGPQEGAAATAGRTVPTPMGTLTDVGDGWSLTVDAPARDITDSVMAENSFNEPPPQGFRFVGVDVTYTYNGEGSDSAFTTSTKAVALTNLELSSECGSIRGQVDLFSDVFAGGSVSGTICFVVPEGGFDMVLYTTTFIDDYVHEYFATK